MTKLTKNQKATIVRLFASGTSTANLAEAYGVSRERIEELVRVAMLRPEREADEGRERRDVDDGLSPDSATVV